jgi:hypothetical protein
MKKLATLLLLYFTCFQTLFGSAAMTRNILAASSAYAQEYSASERFSPEQLDNLLASIALYPDPLLAQVLLAATFADQVDEAARWLRDNNDSNRVDDQPWDVSVKAVAHYPSVLYMMSDQMDWTTALGQAYVYQSTEVMTSIQRLRALARSAGNLTTNDQQEVSVTGGNIEIFPAQPQYLYVPSYDPGMAYFGPSSYFGPAPANVVFFGPAFPIGAWLNHGWDWRRHRIYYHGWRGDGWISRSRPVIQITNVYVNNRLAYVQINRSIARRPVNYGHLNRYNSIHREVTYSNLIPRHPKSSANIDAANKPRKKDNLDGDNSKLESRRPASSAKESAARERKPAAVQTAPQKLPKESQRPLNPANSTDSRATGQRGRESKARVIEAPANPPPAPPSSPRPTPLDAR